MRALLAMTATIAALAAGAEAASPRYAGSIDAPVVRLSDLFEPVAPEADRVLGPAPPPGGRIVVEAAQLAAIARRFGVAWVPASGGERVVLERPGQTVAAAAILAALRAALAERGVAAEAEIELPGLAPPVLPLAADARPVVAALQADADSGTLRAEIRFAVPGQAPVVLGVAGRFHAMATVLVPTRRLPPGEPIGPGDLRPLRLRAGLVPQGAVMSAEAVIGRAPRLVLAAGRIFSADALGPPYAVRKGEDVAMRLELGPISLAAQGEALEPGAPGARVRVRNPSSGAIVSATVLGPGLVRVAPDAMPLQRPARRVAEAR